MILGATSNGISIASNGTSLTGTVYLDDAFVGAVDLKADVDQSRIAGSSTFSAGQNLTSTTLVHFSGTPTPTVNQSTMGTWATTSAGGYRQRITNLPAGCYRHEWQASIGGSNVGASQGLCAAINGACGNDDYTGFIQSTTLVHQVTVIGFECFSSNQSQVDFGLLGQSSAGSITASNYPINFKLTYFGSGSVYSSTNADTDWASCGHVPADFTGFGTVTNIETQCKREGSDLLMRGKFIAGSPTAAEARLNLKLAGTTLVSSPLIPSLQLAGDLVQAFSGATYFRNTVLIEPSVGYMTFGVQNSTVNGLSKASGTTGFTNSALSINARIPISGWTNSNIIIGQFNGLESCTNTLECTDTFSAKISSVGVVSDENIDWLTGNASVSDTSLYALTFKTGLFSVTPNCTLTPQSNNSGQTLTTYVSSNSASTLSARTLVNNAKVVFDYYIICQKQGADYIGKTAKAVASDQNTRTPGLIKTVRFSASFGGATADTTCTSTPCTIYNNKGSIISSVTRSATGSYTVNFTGLASVPNCQWSSKAYTSGWAPVCLGTGKTSSLINLSCQANSQAQDHAVEISCDGETP
jgi:hypothetical protein